MTAFNFTWRPHPDHAGHYVLTFPNGFERGATATERRLIAALETAQAEETDEHATAPDDGSQILENHPRAHRMSDEDRVPEGWTEITFGRWISGSAER